MDALILSLWGRIELLSEDFQEINKAMNQALENQATRLNTALSFNLSKYCFKKNSDRFERFYNEKVIKEDLPQILGDFLEYYTISVNHTDWDLEDLLKATTETLEFLLQKGVDLNQDCHKKPVWVDVERPTDDNISYYEKAKPLCLLTKKIFYTSDSTQFENMKKMITWIIERGANINTLGKTSKYSSGSGSPLVLIPREGLITETALHVSVYFDALCQGPEMANNKEAHPIVKLLLEKGANPLFKDSQGQTPYDLLVDKSSSLAVLLKDAMDKWEKRESEEKKQEDLKKHESQEKIRAGEK
jgi:hypothetical protein